MANPFKLLPSFRSDAARKSGRRIRFGKRTAGRRPGGWIALAFVFLVLVVTVSPAFYVERIHVEAGKLWNGPDLVTPFSFTVFDEQYALTRERQIEESHMKVFRLDPRAEKSAHERLRRLLTLAATIEPGAGVTTGSALAKKIDDELGVEIPPQVAEYVASRAHDEKFLGDLRTILHHLFRDRGLSSDSDRQLLRLASREDRLTLLAGSSGTGATTVAVESVLRYPGEMLTYLRQSYLPTFPVPEATRVAYFAIVSQILQPNIVFDDELTQARKRAALENMRADVTINAGSRILTAGERVTPLQAAAVDALQGKIRQYNILKSFGVVVFVALAILFMLLYARNFMPQLTLNASNVLMVALPVVFALSAGRLGVNFGGGAAAAFAFPAGMIGMLAIILFDAQFALILVTLSTLLFGLGMALSFSHFIVALVGGFTGVASLYTIKERKEVLITGLRLALINVVAILAVGLILHPERLDLVGVGGGILNGLACYVFTLGFLPLLEQLFGVTTDVRLIELTSTNHPLMRMMEDKAPGSFQHALNVAKLAEPAAEEIGANYLLVRAGAFFHDVGKLLKPKYFSENQLTPEERRIHSKLSPYMSNLIIKNHVKDGIELARKFRLPEKVVDFIPQHQGTGLIKYFYAQALQRAEENDLVSEEEFRYPGPKPQTIEAAIVMLADNVEATATARFSGRTVRMEDFQKLVREIIDEKFKDEQFDECHMTFRDLHQIRESFVRTLLSRYHHRVEYPSIPKVETRDVIKTERPSPTPS